MTATRTPHAEGPSLCGAAGLSGAPGLRGPDRSGGSAPRGDAGLMTLEWLLIVAAIAGIAATTALVVQRVVDDTSEVSVEAGVRFLDAETAAAAAASDANSWRRDQVGADPNFMANVVNNGEYLALPGSYDAYQDRCTNVAADFDDVVTSANFVHVLEYHNPTDVGPGLAFLTQAEFDEALLGGALKAGARCEVRS